MNETRVAGRSRPQGRSNFEQFALERDRHGHSRSLTITSPLVEMRSPKRGSSGSRRVLDESRETSMPWNDSSSDSSSCLRAAQLINRFFRFSGSTQDSGDTQNRHACPLRVVLDEFPRPCGDNSGRSCFSLAGFPMININAAAKAERRGSARAA